MAILLKKRQSGLVPFKSCQLESKIRAKVFGKVDTTETYHDAYVKKLQPDKLEPKSEKCVFRGYPKVTIGYTFYHMSEGKIFVAKNGTFLEKEILSKEVSGRKVDLIR